MLSVFRKEKKLTRFHFSLLNELTLSICNIFPSGVNLLSSQIISLWTFECNKSSFFQTPRVDHLGLSPRDVSLARRPKWPTSGAKSQRIFGMETAEIKIHKSTTNYIEGHIHAIPL